MCSMTFWNCHMADKATAPGHATRQVNKALRRQKILGIARELIAAQGFDAFTINAAFVNKHEDQTGSVEVRSTDVVQSSSSAS